MSKVIEVNKERLKSLTDDELDELEITVRKRIAEVKGKIEYAMSKVHSEGMYSDPHWFSKAKSASRHLGIKHQILLMEKSRRKKEFTEARTSDAGYVRVFVDTAHEILSPEMFKAIQILADERLKSMKSRLSADSGAMGTPYSSEGTLASSYDQLTNKDLQESDPEDFDFSE